MAKNKLLTLFIIAFLLLTVIPTNAAPQTKEDVVADTGFRVNKDGFGFENYGSQVCSGGSDFSSIFSNGSNCYRVTNLTAVEMERMFGDAVCKSKKSDGTCVLSKVAESWMNDINSVAANGHCEGMAVLSGLFYAGIEDPSDFGSSVVNNLELKGNDKLQRELAYWFTTQWFMDDYLIEEDPKTQVEWLIDAFNKNPDTIVPLGIYQRDLSGGHAIAAYAVIDKGKGIYWIMVYDNNYPDEDKYITVDTKKNTWSYESSTNPWVSASSYTGQGNTNPLQIAPLSPRLHQFECDFCNQSSSSSDWSPSSPSSPDTVPDSYQDIYDWLFPSDSDDSSEPQTTPESVPDSYQDIFDWLFPSDSNSPSNTATATPSSSTQDIYDWLFPWLSPTSDNSDNTDTGSPFDDNSSSSPDIIPSQTPSWNSPSDSGDNAVPTARPKPVFKPTQQADESDADEYNRISVNSAINIYIETDDNGRAGYDWEKDETYDEISGVEISRSMGRSSAKLPKNMQYYLWMNSPDEDEWKTFDAKITSPGRYLSLTNIQEAYEYPNFVYSPPKYVKELDIEYEFFEVMAYPKELPGVEFVISDENGEYSFKFDTVYSKEKNVPEAQIDFAIFHNSDAGEVGIWITPVEDEALSEFDNSDFVISGEFTRWDDSGAAHTITASGNKAITMAVNGMFYINYRDWQEGKGFYIDADLDGDDEYETYKEIS